MSINYADYIAKLQEQGLAAIKQAQDASLATFATYRELASQLPTNLQAPTVSELASPVKAIELSFDFASKFLELRKQYALNVAEMLVSAQKAAADVTVRATKAATGDK